MPKKKKEEEEEESELEEEVEPEIDTEKLNELLQSQVREEPQTTQTEPLVRRGSPSLEQVEIDRPTNLEQGVELASPMLKKEDDPKYESIKDPSEDYQGPGKKDEKQYHEQPGAISASSHTSMETLGRGPQRMGQEFHMETPEGSANHPRSIGEYETIQAKKSDDFKGEKTALQEQMDRRYKVKS